jgi:hypothetical protein
MNTGRHSFIVLCTCVNGITQRDVPLSLNDIEAPASLSADFFCIETVEQAFRQAGGKKP